jgi:hypothetical protein
MKPILTLDALKAKHACASQLKLFASMFGQSVEVTEALCVEVSSKFDFGWASLNLLSSDVLAEYKRVTDLARAEYERVWDPAQAEYKRVTDPARAEYNRVTDLARAEYERVWDLARAEYKRVTDLAQAEYERVTDPARAEYKRVKARAFARAYIAMQE